MPCAVFIPTPKPLLDPDEAPASRVSTQSTAAKLNTGSLYLDAELDTIIGVYPDAKLLVDIATS